MAAQTLGDELLQRARKAPYVFRELPLAGKTAAGDFLNAIVDLAFLEGDEWVVVDYKTDQNKSVSLGKYKEQLGYYGELLATLTKKPVKESYLYFLRFPENPVERVK
jgi:ATP-dependent exoDNAse (exonuclease V) beta subunit